jgi:hypothetical protein
MHTILSHAHYTATYAHYSATYAHYTATYAHYTATYAHYTATLHTVLSVSSKINLIFFLSLHRIIQCIYI